MDATLIPGTVPDLLRARSAAVLGHDRPDIPRHLWGKSATVHRIAPSDLGVPLAVLAVDGCESVVFARLDLLSLDLTDRTGRAHAAWWLAMVLEGTIGHGTAWGSVLYNRRRCWGLLISMRRHWHFGGGASVRSSYWWSVQALASLDPDDPRLLPDGSRWVDAEALRVACLHVAITRYPDHPSAAEWRAALEAK